MRPTPTRLARWARMLEKSSAPLDKLTLDAQLVKLASKGGRLTYASNLLRDLRALKVAHDLATASLLELGAHEDRKANR